MLNPPQANCLLLYQIYCRMIQTEKGVDENEIEIAIDVNVDAVDQEAGLVTEEMEVEDIDHDHEIDIGPLDHIGDPDQETEKEGVVLGPIQEKEGKLRIVECEIFTINL